MTSVPGISARPLSSRYENILSRPNTTSSNKTKSPKYDKYDDLFTTDDEKEIVIIPNKREIGVHNSYNEDLSG